MAAKAEISIRVRGRRRGSSRLALTPRRDLSKVVFDIPVQDTTRTERLVEGQTMGRERVEKPPLRVTSDPLRFYPFELAELPLLSEGHLVQYHVSMCQYLEYC